jgi:uncharacterized protein
MKCPACGGVLKEVQQSGVMVDICDQACGGIWFDAFELQKVDEAHESLGEPLMNVSSHAKVPVDHDAKRYCPRCANQPLFRHYFSARNEIEVDDCPACGGIWLDMGELAAIRQEFETDVKRKQNAHQTFDQLFSKDLNASQAQREASLKSAENFARALRFVCPSYWIPGKQKWGAF